MKRDRIINYDTIDGILEKISGPGNDTKHLVELARYYGKGTSDFSIIKEQIPTFTPNASFYHSRNLRNLENLSGYIYLDIDEKIDTTCLINYPSIYSFWKSVSGEGIGALAKIENLNKNNFTATWYNISNHFKNLEIKIDPQCKDITRQNIISYDPDIYINKNCTALNANDIPKDIQTLTYYDSVYSTALYPLAVSNSDEPQLSNTDPNLLIKYSTLLDDYNGQNYIIIEQGKECRNTFVPKKIVEGKRHLWLSGFIKSILYNNKDIQKDRLFNEVKRINKNNCFPSLEIKEVYLLVDWYYNLHMSNKLDYRAKMKKIWFNPYCTLSTTDKRSIVGMEVGKMRKTKTCSNLKSIYSRLKLNNQTVTQKMVLNDEACKYAIRTIKKYWKEITK